MMPLLCGVMRTQDPNIRLKKLAKKIKQPPRRSCKLKSIIFENVLAFTFTKYYFLSIKIVTCFKMYSLVITVGIS